MALAGDDSTQYTIPNPIPMYRICFCFSLFVFGLACVTIYELVWVSFVLNSIQALFSYR